MKSVMNIKKSLKLLLRSKASAVVVLIAPLLIVLIIGFGFAGGDEATLNIGIVVPEENNQIDRFINSLDTGEYEIVEYSDDESCKNSVMNTVVLACISFPEGFQQEQGRVDEITFFVDESRMNLVYRLVSSLSTRVEGGQAEIREEITTDLLTVLVETSDGLESSVTDLISIRSKLTNIKSGMDGAASDLGDFDSGAGSASIGDFSGDADNLKKAYEELVTAGDGVIDQHGSNFSNSVEELDDALSDSSSNIDDFDDLVSALGNVTDTFNELRAKLTESTELSGEVASAIDNFGSELNTITSEIQSLRVEHEEMIEKLDTYQFRDASSIATPITTDIQPITSNLNQLTYSFPYLLMLVVMLVGIMLSSTLVFMEKDSRAFFRNFTTPTKSIFFTTMTYITSSIVIFSQVIIILLFAYLLLDIPLLENLDVTFVLILLSMTVFILLGMLIGQILNTSEAITMTNIATGSVLIFLSNLILPIETLNDTIRLIANFNPYVITSEALRMSLLFGASYENLLVEFATLAGYSILLFILILVFRRITSSRYLHHKHKKKVEVPEEKYLKLHNKTIKNLEELLNVLKEMSDEEYKKHTKPKNEISEWIRTELKESYLSRRIKRKDRKKTIIIIENKIKKN